MKFIYILTILLALFFQYFDAHEYVRMCFVQENVTHFIANYKPGLCTHLIFNIDLTSHKEENRFDQNLHAFSNNSRIRRKRQFGFLKSILKNAGEVRLPSFNRALNEIHSVDIPDVRVKFGYQNLIKSEHNTNLINKASDDNIFRKNKGHDYQPNIYPQYNHDLNQINQGTDNKKFGDIGENKNYDKQHNKHYENNDDTNLIDQDQETDDNISVESEENKGYDYQPNKYPQYIHHRKEAKKKFLEEELKKKQLKEEQAHHLKEKRTQENVFMDYYDYDVKKDQPNKILNDDISMEKIDSETVDSADFDKKYDPNYNGNNQLKYEKKVDSEEILKEFRAIVIGIQKISQQSSFKEKTVISFPFDYRNYSLNDIRDSLYKFLNYSDALYLNLSQATTKEDAIKYIELIK
uniref:Uncharacterized protein n=1 Tax=Acrobeloides nanus TaxID=290746 RepID=A0A914C520_9BILA